MTEPAPPRVLALDIGRVRIGVALTDPLGYTAQPLLTIVRKNRTEDLRTILRLTRKHDVTRILVGNPLHLSGDPSPWTLKVHEFTAQLRLRTPIPIDLVDERLTSVAAHEILDAAGHPQRDRKQIIDQLAAVLILESWMQTHQMQAQQNTGD